MIRLPFNLAGKEVSKTVTDASATVLAGVLAVGAVFNGYQDLTTPDAPPLAFANSCDNNGHDAGHQAVVIGSTGKLDGLPGKEGLRKFANSVTLGHVAQDNRTWSDMASYLSGPQGHGYTITPISLAELNPDLATYNKGKLSPNIIKFGAACINLPGPTFYGIKLSDGKQTAGDLALDSGLSFAQLKAMNPGVTSPDETIEKGKVIRTKKTVDTSFALRTFDGTLSNYTKDPAKVNEIKIANDLNVDKGAPAYLPLSQTPAMVKAGITVPAEIAQYKHSANHLNRNQIITPKHEKAPTEHETVHYKLNHKQIEIIDTLDVPEYQKRFIKEVLPGIMQTVEDGYHWNPVALMGMAADETGFGSSQIARGGYNLFGVKAMGDWHGPVMRADGSEENSNGTSTGQYSMSWRKYSSYYESIKDYGLFIGNHKWFLDATKCDQSYAAFLKGMEYKLDTKDCTMLPGQSRPGALEPAHATEHKYVQIIKNNFIKPYNMQQIVDAGAPYKIDRG